MEKMSKFRTVVILFLLAAICAASGAENQAHASSRLSCNRLLKSKNRWSSSKPASDAFIAISEIIDNQFAGFDLGFVPSTLLRGPGISPRPQDLYFNKVQRDLLQLTANEQESLLTRIRRQYSDLSKVPIFFRVTLNDVESWLELFDSSTAKPRGNRLPILEAYLPFSERMPEEAKGLILEKIAARYSDAQKNDPKKINWITTLYPKRILDAWIKALLPADAIFLNTYGKTKNSVKAYQGYLNSINSSIIEKMPSNTQNYGSVTARHILSLAKAVQDFLNDPEISRSRNSSMKSRILLYGSIVKGMGKNGSDLDALFDDVSSINEKNLNRIFEDYLSEAAKAIRLPIKLNVDEDPHNFIKGDDLRLSQLEPFFIEVTPDAIAFLVVLSPKRDGDGIVDPSDKVTFERVPVN